MITYHLHINLVIISRPGAENIKKVSIFNVIDIRLLFSTIFLKVIRQIHFCMPLQTAFEFYQHHAPFIPSSKSPKRLSHHKQTNKLKDQLSMHRNSVGSRKLFVTSEMSILLQPFLLHTSVNMWAYMCKLVFLSFSVLTQCVQRNTNASNTTKSSVATDYIPITCEFLIP